MLKTPVVFLIFNRPTLTETVFEQIRQAQPQKLLVVADGPRFPEEEQKCQDARNVISKVDWKCEVITNYSYNNMGCKQRISSGLNWAFSLVEDAIILEDDCLPCQSFFSFCANLLEHYREDSRIMHISGNNFQDKIRNPYSYYFSKYNHIWGWATWRRAWKYYDVNMGTWEKLNKQDFIRSICSDPYEQKYWLEIFDSVYQGNIDTWDYQWTYTCWLHHGLSVLPNTNLVSNIGFGSDATRTKEENSPVANLLTKDIGNLAHPNFIIQHPEADAYTFDYILRGIDIKNTNFLKAKLRSIKKKIKNNFHKINDLHSQRR